MMPQEAQEKTQAVSQRMPRKQKRKSNRQRVTIGIGFVKNSLNNLWSSVIGFFGGKTVNVGTKATKKADGGVFSGGSWKSIKKYAVGGLPNMGQMLLQEKRARSLSELLAVIRQ